MARHPHLGVPKSKPRFPGAKPNGKPASKEEISRLSREYLQIRNEHQRVKMLSAQMTLAQERGELVSRRLVEEAQSGWLLIAVRQKILNMPQTYARRLVDLKDVSEVRKVLEGAAISILNEIKDLPRAVTNPNWLAELEEKDARTHGK